jgi:hypothetical protein
MEEKRTDTGRRIADVRCGDCKVIRTRTDECLQLIKDNLKIQQTRFDDFIKFVDLRHDTARKEIDVKIESKVSRFTLRMAVGLLGIVFAAFTWQISELRTDLKSMPAIAAIQRHVVETQGHVVSIQQDLVLSLSKIEPAVEEINNKIDHMEKMEIIKIKNGE